MERRATRVGTFEVYVPTHHTLRIFVLPVLASQLSANILASELHKIGEHVALLVSCSSVCFLFCVSFCVSEVFLVLLSSSDTGHVRWYMIVTAIISSKSSGDISG